MAAAAPPAASVMVPVYAVTDRSAEAVLPSATVYVNTRAVVPVPLEYDAEALLLRVRAPLLVTTASSQVTVIEIVSPTPNAPSPVVSATLDRSGASPSTVTSPKSPDAAPAAPPAASVIVPPKELTDRSAEAVSPSAMVVVKTSAVDPVPLA